MSSGGRPPVVSFRTPCKDLASLRALYARGRTLFDHQQQACEALGFAWMTEHQRRALVRIRRACFLRYCLLTAKNQLILMFQRCVAYLWRRCADGVTASVDWAGTSTFCRVPQEIAAVRGQRRHGTDRSTLGQPGAPDRLGEHPAQWRARFGSQPRETPIYDPGVQLGKLLRT